MRGKGESARPVGKAAPGASAEPDAPGAAIFLLNSTPAHLDWLQEEGSGNVNALSEAFEVSEPTIRQDLERVESEG